MQWIHSTSQYQHEFKNIGNEVRREQEKVLMKSLYFSHTHICLRMETLHT